MADFSVTFLPSGPCVTVPGGTALLAAAAAAGFTLQASCGGQGRCGKCLVQARGVLSQPTRVERAALSPEQLASGWRLACQALVAGDTEVTIPESSLVIEHRIMADGAAREIEVLPNITKTALNLPHPSIDDPRSDLSRLLEALGGAVRSPSRVAPLRALPPVLRQRQFHVTAVAADGRLLAVEPGDTTDACYGCAVDIGTTTVVLYLCHLPTGKCVATTSDLNSQAQWGDDVISRIRAATTSTEDLAGLSHAIVTVINDLVERACHEAGVPETAIYEFAVVGNTCMGHLLLGVPPDGLARLPFVQAFRAPQSVRAADLGLAANPEAELYLVPSIGGFVGADTVGVILASELDRADGLRVAVDIGTNGEIVVARDGELHAASTAAGPAFEGARIGQGMRAAQGAIDSVHIADDVVCHTIGDSMPRGLCGSGLVDAVAELVRVGVITETGRMLRRQETSSLPEKLARRLIEDDAGVQFLLALPEETYGGEGVALTSRDVRETQLAKAAIYGGMELLLEELGARPGDVQQLLLAGAFGNYIKRESAVAIGLIPALPPDRIKPIGNAAGVGARLVLCSTDERARAETIARQVQHVDFSERKGFYDRFADAMMLRPLP
ncbi:MAG: ASKHA domain-containing protein [Armatimonadota bacterium]